MQPVEALGSIPKTPLKARRDDDSLQPDEVSGLIPDAPCKVQILAHILQPRSTVI